MSRLGSGVRATQYSMEIWVHSRYCSSVLFLFRQSLLKCITTKAPKDNRVEAVAINKLIKRKKNAIESCHEQHVQIRIFGAKFVFVLQFFFSRTHNRNSISKQQLKLFESIFAKLSFYMQLNGRIEESHSGTLGTFGIKYES